MAFTHGHALIVGVGSYQHAPGMKVDITVDDAEAVAAVLADERLCGYPAHQVSLLSDGTATRAGIIDALTELAMRTTADDTVFIFYAGHGMQGDDGAYYLTTHDTRFNANKVTSASGVRESELVAALRAITAKRLLLIVNACHAGRLSPVLGPGEGPLLGKPLPQTTASALLSTGEGRIIITACRDTQYAYIGPGPLTLFAQALVAGLRGEGTIPNQGYVGAFDLYLHTYYTLADDVPSRIPADVRAVYGEKQEPELTVLRGVGPFPVALYRGATTLGTFDDSEQLPQSAAVRQVNPERSQQQMQALARQHNLNIGAGARVGAAIAGDVTGNIVVGSVGDTVDTGGGAYAGRSLDMRGAIANIGATLDHVVQRVGTMRHGDAVSRAELQQLIAQLSAELQSAPPPQATAASDVAEKTRQAVEQAAKPVPNKALLRVNVEVLKTAAENIGGALPAVLPIVMKIADALAK